MYPKKERMLSGSPINTIPQHMLSLFAHVLVQTSAPPLDAGGAAAASATSSGTNGAAANATPSCNGSGGSNVAEQAAFLETTLGLTQLDWSRLGDFCCRLQQLVNSRAAAAAALPSSAPQKLPVSAQICCTDVTPGPPSWRQPDTRGLPKVTPKDEHQKHTAAQGEKQGGVLVRVADAAAAAGAQPASGDKRASCMRELRCGQDDHRAKPDPELKQGRDVASAAAGAAEAKPAAPQQASRQPAAAAAAPPAAAAAPAAAPVRYPARIRTKARPPSISESGAANSAAAPDNCGSSSAGSGSHGAAHQRGRRRASGAASPPPDAAVPPPPAFSPPHAAPRLHGAAAAGGADGDGAFEARLQLPAQDHRYAARTSVGGRNYTDEQLRQLQLIEAEVVARATPGDHAAFNLPRQARTLALTNMFKYIALRGAARLHAMAVARGLEGRTGRHSNFYDGKIDTRIVAVVKHDMDDAAATASRKFSKVLLSLLAEGCGDPSCDWSYATFASDNINRLQARSEAGMDAGGGGGSSGSAATAAAPAAAAGEVLYGRSVGLASPRAAAAAAAAAISAGSAAARGRRKAEAMENGGGGGAADGGGSAAAPDASGVRHKKYRRFANGGSNAASAGSGIAGVASPGREEEAFSAARLLQSFKGTRGASAALALMM